MRKATTIKPQIYSKPKFLRYGPASRFVFLFLLTGPETNLTGIVRYPIEDICLRTGYDRRQVLKAIEPLVENGSIYWDEPEGLFFITNWLKHNPLTNDRLETGFYKWLERYENHIFHKMAISALSGADNDTLSIGYRYGIDTPLGQGQGILSESEGEEGSKKIIDISPKPSPTKDAKKVLEYWNQKHGRNISTTEKIKAAIKRGLTIEDCKLIIDFKTDEWTRTEFERFLRPQTLFAPTKVKDYLSEAREHATDTPGGMIFEY